METNEKSHEGAAKVNLSYRIQRRPEAAGVSTKAIGMGGEAGQVGAIRVVIADDHPVTRRGLVMALSGSASIQVIGEASDGHEALRLARELRPDVLVLDIGMPRIHGVTVAGTLLKEGSKTRILILSEHRMPEMVLGLLRAGATGYMLKDASAAEVLQAVETVNRGESFLSAEIAHVALNRFVRRAADTPDRKELSDREKEVLTYIAEGLCNKEIACRLNLSTRTVETHRERLMRKLNIHSIAGLTRFAILEGFVPVPELRPMLSFA